MSNFESDVEVADCGGTTTAEPPTFEVLSPREVLLGPRQEVRRVLPNKNRRMIGAWCFVDHYGPEDITGRRGMWVPPHPHSGLQTVSWLLEGEVQHRDSLGSNAVVVPGQLNLMTSGAGISHSEESPPGHSALMHGLQLWVAMPDPARMEAPRDFTQYRDLPVLERPGLRATVVLGEFEGAVSPATTYTPIVGVELDLDGAAVLELDAAFEHGVLAVAGALALEGQRVDRSEIGYLGGGRDRVSMAPVGDRPTRAFLLGGEPFAEQLVMWWNFIGRSHEEIVEFRRIWNSTDRSYDGGPQPGVVDFGQVLGFDGERLPAPPMPTTRLRARPRTR